MIFLIWTDGEWQATSENSAVEAATWQWQLVGRASLFNAGLDTQVSRQLQTKPTKFWKEKLITLQEQGPFTNKAKGTLALSADRILLNMQ